MINSPAKGIEKIGLFDLREETAQKHEFQHLKFMGKIV